MTCPVKIMRHYALLTIIHLDIHYSLWLNSRGRRRGQSLSGSYFIRCIQVFPFLWQSPSLLCGFVARQSHRGPTRKLWRRYWRTYMWHLWVCAEEKFVCGFYLWHSSVWHILYETIALPTPLTPLLSISLCQWTCTAIFGERADVTSGLNREPITVSAGVWDARTNCGLLQTKQTVGGNSSK